MKKLLAVLLALLMILSFTACGNDTETESETDADTESTPATESETNAESTETETETESNTEAETEPVAPPVDNTFVDRDETVYVNGANALNIRSSNEIVDGNVVGSLKEGTSVKRVGYNEVWSKIEYNGTVCYASSKYLSTKAPLAFTDVDEVVYVKVENTVTLRSKPWAESESLAYLANGIALNRTGIASDIDEFGSAWSRVKYVNNKGETVEGYINSKFLTVEAPIAFTEVDETVVITNCETLNIRAEASTSGKTLASPIKGTEIQRIGIAAKADKDGIVWSMLMYEGNVCYASSSYLTLKADLETAETEAADTTETVAVG